ncbi:MAG: COX15/CtaA family protein [Candidatus Heimdallarchaeota archaeon]|nr:COX15/CtaA family protein [Candidatus Heimdallarchaeota archaeon]MDH5644825.1 COX15/CtaA family protein [Candidatus Heimdallarchaeota archaeon]
MKQVSDGYRRLTYLLVSSTFILILMGGYVKAIGAGLACPDWPLCYGVIFPFNNGEVYPYTPWQIFTEWFHRLFASLVGLLLLIIVAKSYKYKNSIKELFNLGVLLSILFAIQVLLGALTVWQLLNPFTVVLHLGNAVMIIMMEMVIAFLATYYSLPVKQ